MRFVGIDPSTKTGFVALDPNGNVVRAKELTGVGTQDPKRMVTLIDEIMAHIQTGDIVAIESFAHNAGFGKKSRSHDFQYGLGWGIRMALYRRKIPFHNIAPNQLRKFVGVSDWVGEVGSKKRLKSDDLKKLVMNRCRTDYSFYNPSDNVNDAFVLAMISRTLSTEIEVQVTKEQLEVIQAIKNPAVKQRKKSKVGKSSEVEQLIF